MTESIKPMGYSIDNNGTGRVYVGGGFFQEFKNVKDMQDLIARFRESQAAGR